MGAFFNQLHSGDLAGQLPWLSMAGSGDVLAVMTVALGLALRHQRHSRRALPQPPTSLESAVKEAYGN
jgi:NAD(P)H-hydrate repair Nnr-like enzyme with NAD(P)H-hydrate dehydratase domain